MTPEKYLECSIIKSIQCLSFQKIGLLEHLGTIMFTISGQSLQSNIIPAIEISNICTFHICTDMRGEVINYITIGLEH